MGKEPLPTGSRSQGRRLVGFLSAWVVLLAYATATAVPRIPPTDATVLQRVPAPAATRELQPLRAHLQGHPDDLQNTLALAEGYLQIGRTNGDPRFVSYAQATLNPWLSRRDPDPAVLTLAATTLQYLHRFAEALSLLDRALAVQPENGKAWLTKAAILQVQGRFDEARRACRPLTRTNGQLISLTCLTGINSLTGHLNESYRALRSIYVDDPHLPAGVRAWILDTLADMARRAGDNAAAEQYLIAALRAAPQDAYSKAEYADLLLLENRNTDVVQLLRADEQQDNLLLRLAIAGRRLGSVDGRRWSDLFQARYEAARRDGDFTHLREQARFMLEVRSDSGQALQLAAQSWQAQREPADVRVYLAASAAAGNPRSAQSIRDWIKQTGYEDRSTPETETPPRESPLRETRASEARADR